MKPRTDKAEYADLGMAPDFMSADADLDEDFLVRASRDEYNYLVSRARYAGYYAVHKNRHREGDRLQLLIASDEIEASGDRNTWMDVMYGIYPEDPLSNDEMYERPSDDVEVRARLLNVFLQKLMLDQKVPPNIRHDLHVILSLFDDHANEKNANAQRLLLSDKTSSLTKLAESSEGDKTTSFGQSCLSQWIDAGLVFDPHAQGRARDCVPRGRSASPPVSRGEAG